MGLFCDQTENEKEITIVCKLAAYYGYGKIVLMIFMLFVFLQLFMMNKQTEAIIAFIVFFLIVRLISLPFFRMNKMVKAAMKSGKLKISGSNYSFKKPLTYIITK